MTQVKCIVVDQEIAARACVDRQIESRCFCPRAVLAINEVAQIAMPKSRLADQLDTCRAMAQAMLKKPADQRYAGPALRKTLGEPEPAEIPLPSPKKTSTEEARGKPAPSGFLVEGAMSTPARRVVPKVDARADEREAAIQERENDEPEEDAPRPTWPEFHAKKEVERAAAEDEEPMRPPAICAHADCRTALRANNLSNLCRLHRNQVTSRKRKNLVPAVVRAAGTARNALEAEPLPSKEKGRRCAVDGCERILADKTRGDKCAPCCKGIKPGSGWEPCAHAPRCPRMAQRWIDPLCALCRSGRKYHLRTDDQLRVAGIDPEAVPVDATEPKEKKMSPTGVPKRPKGACPGCGKGLRSDNDRAACTKCINGLPPSMRPLSGGPVDPSVFAKWKEQRARALGMLAKATKPTAPPEPPKAPPSFPGMPAFDQVPLGWTVGFLRYLKESSIAVESVERAA